MTPTEKTERQGVLNVAHNDFGKTLNSYAFFKVSDHAMGQDLVQDTFIKTWRYLVKGGKIDKMKAFLYHILNNLIIDEYRKRKNKSVSLDVLLEDGFDPGVTERERSDNIFDGKGAVLMIKHLPLMYQNVMRMKYLQDLSLKEISLITGQTKNTVAVQLHRGLIKLKLLYSRS